MSIVLKKVLNHQGYINLKLGTNQKSTRVHEAIGLEVETKYWHSLKLAHLRHCTLGKRCTCKLKENNENTYKFSVNKLQRFTN